MMHKQPTVSAIVLEEFQWNQNLLLMYIFDDGTFDGDAQTTSNLRHVMARFVIPII